ncbi:serine hydrolase domain-containing protein [Kineosporia babensis]|uniref:Beta-lactamase family protein n=1 Tax=Kineosporia babensis TaxID=499548 RepID=A0A9X1STI9_9ACTN|nr:serine hydrolase domain-containing protein [Kineosporia babensis]MCD5311877.1 beta-lactamase family protein [Kineosporia babensis]
MRFQVSKTSKAAQLAGGVAALSALALIAVNAQADDAQARPKNDTSHKSAVEQRVRAELNEYLETSGETEHATAASVRITYPGRQADVAVTAGEARNNSLWQIGSNTKAMTSMVLLQLEAEGKLSIDDSLGRWLPQYAQWKDVTIRQLLGMTSGIPGYTESPEFIATLREDPERTATAEELIAFVEDAEVGANTYAYSNTNYLLAQLVVEEVTGDSYFDQVHRRILKPLGMKTSCFAPETCSPKVATKIPDGYSMQSWLPELEGQAVPKLALSWGQGAGGLVSSLEDMTTWQRALYTGWKLPEKQQTELKSLTSVVTSRPVTELSAEDPVGFGLGVAQKYSEVSGQTWAYEGATFGYRVLHMYVPETGVLLAVAVNSSVDTSTLPELADQIYQAVNA